MNVLKPNNITLISSNVPENDHPEWSGITDYAIGDRVISTSTHRIYEAIAASGPSNGGAVDPDTDDIGTVSASWSLVGATNRYKMLDEYINTQTEKSGDIVFEISASACNGLVLIGMEGDSVTIVHKDRTGATIATTTHDLLIPVDNWRDYFYSPVEYNASVLYVQLSGEYGATCEVTIASSGTSKLGTVVIGYVYNMGITLQNVDVGILDYSIKDTDAFGRTSLIKGLNATQLSIPCTINTGMSSDLVVRRLKGFAGTPAVWIGDTTRDSLIVYGFYNDFSLTIPYGFEGAYDEYTLSIEGVV